MFEYRFTNCSYREHEAGNISNPSKTDDIIHYFHFFLTFNCDNINTRDFLFLSSVTASYNSSTRTCALWRHVHRQAGANCTDAKLCFWTIFQYFFYPNETWTHPPTSNFFLDFLNFFNFAKPLTSQDKFIGALLGSLRKCIDKEISIT